MAEYNEIWNQKRGYEMKVMNYVLKRGEMLRENKKRRSTTKFKFKG
jgi:hypothetical protein